MFSIEKMNYSYSIEFYLKGHRSFRNGSFLQPTGNKKKNNEKELKRLP